MLLYIFSTHHMILERFSIYLFMYGMILLPKDVYKRQPLKVEVLSVSEYATKESAPEMYRVTD